MGNEHHDSEVAKQKYDFAIEEFKSLRTEISNTAKSQGALEKTVAGACAAIYLWLLKGDHVGPWQIWLVPVVLAFLGGLRAAALALKFSNFSKYILEIENLFYSGRTPKGWEHFRSPRIGWKIDGIITLTFWIILFAITVVAAVVRP